MSCKGLFVACAVTVAGAARLHNELESSVLDSIGRHGENPEEFWASFNSSLLMTDQSFWQRRRRTTQPAANAPLGGTNAAWAQFRPTILAIDGSDNLGRVSSVYTFGAPSSAKLALTDDYHGDGCFDGYRIFSGEGAARDPVSWLATSAGFVHARMKAMTIHNGEAPWILPCSDATTRFPPSDSALQLALHFTSGYLQTVRTEVQHMPSGEVETHAATMRSVYVNHAEAAELGRGVGYNFVAEAANGDDLTRLFQNPDTLDCIVSFRGSDNAGDWINNAGAGSRQFCNFEDVHSGFVQKFTNTVTAPVFQANIRANLPKCASLKVTGHSLGGAVAEMFSGCVNRGSTGLQTLEDLPRGSGLTAAHRDWMTYMSYKGQIAWNRGTPERMPPFA